MTRHLTLVHSNPDDLALADRDTASALTLRPQTRLDMVMARLRVARRPDGLGPGAA